MYKINPSKYTGVTVMPAEIAEKHLILASGNQLKVIIYAFSRAGGCFSIPEISRATGVSEEETEDALTYWKELGFILTAEESADFGNNTASSVTEAKTAAPSVSVPQKKEKVPHHNPSRLTYDQILARMDESENVRILLNEAQLRLGRTIGTGDMSSLVLLHDYYGLPVEVILSICEFAAQKGKSSNMNYIYKIGADWSSREIDTLERADEELKSIERANTVWAEFSAAVRLPSSKPTTQQEKYLSQWTSEWGFSVPMLALAFEEMRDNTDRTSFPYMHKVLSSWHTKGIKTPEAVAKEKEEFKAEKDRKILEKSSAKNKAEKAAPVPDPNASYDILRAEQRAKAAVPKFKKRDR
jgi:DNA replication protein DnaD